MLPIQSMFDERCYIVTSTLLRGGGRDNQIVKKQENKRKGITVCMTGNDNDHSIAVKITKCPKVFCTRLYPRSEKINYQFNKNAHKSLTVYGYNTIFSGE